MTPHINAEKGQIAKTVIMPGDPYRAKYIAEHYLEEYKLVNEIRGMFAYTGKYKGKEITVMASGMGMPSIGIYSYELYKEYDVDVIIRVGSAGAYQEQLKLYDVILVDDCYSESSFALTQNGCRDNIISANKELTDLIEKTANSINQNVIRGRIHSGDVFYKENDNYKELVSNYNCIACEMESFALFHNANVLTKKAACLLTISNSLITNEETTSEERQNSFNDMILLALESIIKL